ncbi:MAG: nuclear transport factor 2 family protein [Burkholderiales bacterium]|nr:nuclear transport factor 2 family protein [Burkholderiales bacterium]
MARAPIPPAVLAGSPDEVEARLYEALRRGDIEQLMALWADDEEIVCVHPGGPRVIGAAAIRASFEAVFAGGGIPVQPEQVHRLHQMGSALHHLVERIEIATEGGLQLGWVLATNFYVKTAQGWRLASHHASPGMPQPPGAGRGEPTATLH